MTPHVRRAAIVGGGWAGLAAAIALAQAGWQVTLHEAARMPGGRARSLELGGARPLAADNGQVVTMTHLLHGVRRELQKMWRMVGEGEFSTFGNGCGFRMRSGIPSCCLPPGYITPRCSI